MVLSRRLDEAEQRLVASGEAFFHVSGAGHEALALLADHLLPQDWLHAHYRDKALLIARGTTVLHFLHGLLATGESHSAGRQMSAHLSDPPRRVLSMVGPVGNNALQAVGVAAQVREEPGQPIVLCCVGEGTTQQGEFYEAVAEAVRDRLPVLFLVEDNQFAISTRTDGRTFLACPGPFFGLDIHKLDGRHPEACADTFAAVTRAVRETRGPAILHFQVERLDSHTNADDQTSYRNADEIRCSRERADPIANLRAHLVSAGVPETSLVLIENEAAAEVAAAEKTARSAPDPHAAASARIPESAAERARAEYRGKSGEGALTLGLAMREVLRHHLAADPRVTLFGQDIADPKGDVFGVTKGLSTQFPGRVVNAPLAESTIVGKSVGRALAGGRPVAFLQFADFLPIAFNQIATELGSMHWRTNGAWTAPVIVMISCGAYRPGLGPFHAHTFESVAAHVPGVDVVMPSNAADAAGLLNAAFASGRPTLFFYPKICLNDRDAATSADVAEQWVAPGRARHLTRGGDLTLVTWGGTIPQCRQTADALIAAGAGVDLIDLRSLVPWDKAAVVDSARRTGKVVIVHEDNLTCGFGSEVAAALAEEAPGVTVRRVTRPDTYVPFHFGNQLELLPSFKRVLGMCADLLGFDVAWTPPASAAAPAGNTVTVEAQGSSPADTGVTVIQWRVKPGDPVQAGQPLAELEGDKAVLDFASPCSGVVDCLLVPEGERIEVGAPLVTVRLEDAAAHRRRPTREEAGTPVLTRRAAAVVAAASARRTGPVPARIVAIAAESGGKLVTNAEIAARFPGHDAEEIAKLTGIRERRHLTPGQTVITLAATAARRALDAAGLKPSDLTAVVCSTSTPASITPTTASLVLAELCKDGPQAEMPAHDVLAACSGYLYALANAHDILQGNPAARVLVVTAEALSPVTNPDDFDTAVLFGDAATATLVCGPDAPVIAGPGEPSRWVMEHRPVLSGLADANAALVVPMPAPTCPGYVTMNGREVFAQAVRAMIKVLGQACSDEHLRMEDLDLIVPHQANARILDAIARRLKAPTGQVFDVIARHGNTSSSTIPLALTQVPGEGARRVGLVAFGGGFTYGAAILRRE